MDDDQPECATLNANAIGYELTKKYYTALNQLPEQAWIFYAEHGDYRTEYMDGTVVVATNWVELNQMLFRPTPVAARGIVVDSVVSVQCGSLERLLVMATGPRFTQTFYLEYRPIEDRSYVIVASFTKYHRDETIADRPPADGPHSSHFPRFQCP